VKRILKPLFATPQKYETETRLKHLSLLYEVVRLQYARYQDSRAYAFIVFSKDRPLQLHALLSSMRKIGGILCPVHVIFYASNAQFRHAYAEVLNDSFSVNNSLRWIEQDSPENLRKIILSQLVEMTSDRIGLLVDDIVFVRECRLSLLDKYDFRQFVPSLRLSERITFSYMLSNSQSQPSFLFLDPFLKWKWSEGGIDWRYPLSLDGNILLRSDLIAMVESINFSSPNTLESGLQAFNAIYAERSGLCFREARLVNIPCNRVQTDFNNRSGSVSTDALLGHWLAGERIRYEDFAELKLNSVHAELPFRFVPRKG
jgi:hypothetical protein